MKKINSEITKRYLQILGNMIKNQRLMLKMTQQELADRVNCSRQTIAKLEHGNPKVTIGTYFETTYILDIPLFVETQQNLNKLETGLATMSELLPSRVKSKEIKIDNEF